MGKKVSCFLALFLYLCNQNEQTSVLFWKIMIKNLKIDEENIYFIDDGFGYLSTFR